MKSACGRIPLPGLGVYILGALRLSVGPLSGPGFFSDPGHEARQVMEECILLNYSGTAKITIRFQSLVS